MDRTLCNMRFHYPYISLILLLITAAVSFTGGSRIARREEMVKIERNIESLNSFIAETQTELFNLERLYENHLCRIARDMPVGDSFAIRRAGNWLEGLKQITLLFPRETRAEKELITVSMNPSTIERLPQPVFQTPEKSLQPEKYFLLPDFLKKVRVHESGWIDQPGNYIMFWYKNTTTIVVMVVDLIKTQNIINNWMQNILKDNFIPAGSACNGNILVSPDKTIIAQNGIIPPGREKYPDLVIPIRTRFGYWRLLSWDGWEQKIHYHTPTLLGTGVFSLSLLLLAIVIFIQQKTTLKLAQQRVSFINRVSHELRTPLTNIILNVDLANDSIDDNQPQIAQRLSLVKEECKRLSRLIDNVLTFSRKEQKGLNINSRSCVPDELINKVLAHFCESFKRRAIDIKLEGHVTKPCDLDSDAFSQILTNLVSNVEKYAAAGKILNIQQSIENNMLIIKVSDNGPGITDREREIIFQPFYRINNKSNEGAGGAGLGLSISRELALSMNGTLLCLLSDKGAVFELKIPFNKNEE